MQKGERAVLMTEGKPWKLILGFAFPLFLGNLFQQLYNVVDSLVVGNLLGSDALAAVASSANIIHLLVGLITGVFTGAGAVIARYFGARDHENLRKAVHTTVAFALVCGIAVTAAGTFFVPHLLVLMGTPAEVLPNSILYFRIYFLGVLFSVMYNAASGIFQAVGDSRHPLVYLILSSVLNVLLDLLFVARFGMGVDGAALATVLSQAVSAALGFARLIRSESAYRVMPAKIRFHKKQLWQILTMGIPAGIQNSIISVANVVVQSSINLFGAEAVAGCGCYSKIEGFGFLPISAFAMALVTYVSQNLGAGEVRRARKGARFGILSGVLLAECIGLSIYLLAPKLISLFNGTEAVVSFGTLAARTVTPFYFLLAFSHTVAGTLRGAGKAVVPMLVMMIIWCGIRVTYLFLFARPSGQLTSVMWCYPLTWSLSSIVFLIYYFKGNWARIPAGKTA